MEKRIKQCIGIDCSQNELVVSFAVLDASFQQSLLSNTKFKNTLEGFQKLKQWGDKLSDPGMELNYVIEATGVYHEKVSVYLTSQGAKMSVILPNKAKAFFQTLSNKTITDKSCGQMLSQLGLEKTLDKWEPPHPVYNTLKQLTRERAQLISEQTLNKNQLHAEESGAWINKNSVKRIKQRLNLLDKQLTEISENIEEILGENQWLKEKIERVCSIKGIGILTAIIIVAETNGFNLIRNKKQLVSYAGIDVKDKTSGTSVHAKPRISKQGNSYLRASLFFPAFSAIRYIPAMKNLYARIVAKQGIKKKALVAVQRKILELVYVLWKKNECFDANYQIRKAKKEEGWQKPTLHELA